MITPNNYETYFLLLADKELSPEEETMVKQFAARHPDLQEELDLLLSCCLAPEPMPVFPKEKLLRPAIWNAEQPEPVHTQLLLLLDNELPQAEKNQLEQQIAASVALQAEWNTLQQTRLTAEMIAYPDKASLYRSNRKVRPVLWMRWAAAAAVVIGMGWMLWLKENTNSVVPATSTIVALTPSLSRATTTDQPVKQQVMPVQTNTPVAVATNEQTTATVPAPQPGETVPIKNNDQKGNYPEASSIIAANDQPVYTTESEPYITTLDNTIASLDPLLARENRTVQVAPVSIKTITLPVAALMEKENAFTGNRAGLDNDEEEEYISVGGARIKKQKMRGIFRNISRSVTRTFSKSKIEPEAYASRN